MAGVPSDLIKTKKNVRIVNMKKFPLSESQKVSFLSLGHLKVNLEVRKLCCDLQLNSDSYGNLLRIVNNLMLEDVPRQFFNDVCESLASLLYFSLAYDRKSDCMISTVKYFLHKWFFHLNTSDLDSLVLNIENEFKTPLLACVLLLFNHFNPSLSEEVCCSQLVHWDVDSCEAPQWLKDILGSSADTYKCLKHLLVISLFPHRQIQISGLPYVDAIKQFLTSCSLYHRREHENSIDILSTIKSNNCTTDFSSFVLLFIGLNLYAVKKYQSALLMFKKAIYCSEKCFYAVYFAAKIYFKLHMNDACIQSLRLLKKIEVSKLSKSPSLQKLFIDCHLPSHKNFYLRIQWTLCVHYWYYEKWKDSADEFDHLLKQWSFREAEQSDSSLFVLLPLTDRIPRLPSSNSSVLLGYVISLFQLNKHSDIDECLEDFSLNSECLSKFNESDIEQKVEGASYLLIQLLYADSLFMRKEAMKALIKCSKAVSVVESLFSSDDSSYGFINLLKSYAYRLSKLIYGHPAIDQIENANHFLRLANQFPLSESQVLSSNFNYDEIWQFLLTIMSTFIYKRINQLK